MRCCRVCGSEDVVGGVEVCPPPTRGQVGHVHSTAMFCARDLVASAALLEGADMLVTVVVVTGEEWLFDELEVVGVEMGKVSTTAQIVDKLTDEFRQELDGHSSV